VTRIIENLEVKINGTVVHRESSPRYFHERDLAHCGGRTWAVIWKGNMRYVGVAEVAPGDQFSRKRGRQIASGRAATCQSRHRSKNRFGFSVSQYAGGDRAVLIHGGADGALSMMQYLLANAPPSLWKEKT
jgi:hypothetical protein